MIRSLLFCLIILTHSVVFSQISFSNATHQLVNSSLRSGVAIGVCDMNNDGLDDVIRLHTASDLQFEYQQYDGSFEMLNYGDLGNNGEWGMAVADVDENGYCDVIAGGNHNDLKLVSASNDGSSYSSTILDDPQIFLQNINFADIDNDGAIDIFACHDVGLSAPFKNDGSGNFTHDLSLINPVSTIPSDNSGNYGSIWTDYDQDGDLDLYISKCRQGVSDPMDGRRVNLMFENDGSNNFIDVAESIGLRPLAQSWQRHSKTSIKMVIWIAL